MQCPKSMRNNFDGCRRLVVKPKWGARLKISKAPRKIQYSSNATILVALVSQGCQKKESRRTFFCALILKKFRLAFRVSQFFPLHRKAIVFSIMFLSRAIVSTLALSLALGSAAAAVERFNEIKIREDAVHNSELKSPLPHTYIGSDDLPDSFTWADVDGVSYLTHSLNQHVPQCKFLSKGRLPLVKQTMLIPRLT